MLPGCVSPAEEKNRKFLLERKTAELLAQLARVGGAARFVARSSAAPGRAELLLACSEQVTGALILTHMHCVL